ncbi:uncharacterized protein LOC110109999 [Dendrobium catenatum]|uniref:uncharacterized protein LOC110109999 n=1 Tax=Dendrobium catenatum TaxID=906689 RepID=UPI0009F49D78|nr:uncharacterized protein LOC110109999 [Dendrobium catenatum]
MRWLGSFCFAGQCLMRLEFFFFNLKLSGEFTVTILNPNNVLIKLANDLDYGRIFAHRSYFIFGCFMKIIKWNPYLDLSEESPIVPVWLSFPELHPHLFSPRILFGLGSIFGRPIQSDNNTAVGSRPFVARILVEMDISKSHPHSVWLGPDSLCYIQKVVMEGLPSFCSHCKEVGHKNSDCVKLHPLLRKVAALVLLNPIMPEVVMPQVLNDLAIDNEDCGNVSSRDVGFPVSVGKLVGNLDPSPGVALAGSHIVGPSDNMLVSFDKLGGVNQLAMDVAIDGSEGDIVVSDNVIFPVVVSHNAIPSNIVLRVIMPRLLNEEVVEPFALSPLGKGCAIAVASSDCLDFPDVAGVVH